MCINLMQKKIHGCYTVFSFILMITVSFFIYQNHFYHTKTIAISWSNDSFDMNQKYKICIYLGSHVDGRVQIKAKIYTSVDDFFSHDIGVIGVSKYDLDDVNFADIIDQWGIVKWKSDGVYIGNDAKPVYFLPKEKFKTF